MDVKQVEQYIAEVLTEKFECEFEVVSGHRHFEFRRALLRKSMELNQ